VDNTSLVAAAQAAAGGLTVEIVSELTVAAPPEKVWQALTGEVNSWWSHSFTEQPYSITLEARIGGRFYEAFDDVGNGALFATVIYCEPPRKLKYVGAMGMARPVLNQSTWELAESEGGTRVRKVMEVFGVVPAELAEGYRRGSDELLAHLKALIETGTKVR
jgi:uncharacterized protein YndB with AHSA1/START domain